MDRLGCSCGLFRRMPDASTWNMPDGRFEVLKALGKGAEGELFLMRDRSREHRDDLVAVKIINRGGTFDEKRVLREIMIQSRIHHITIIKVFQVMLTESHLAIIMEYAKGGDLFTYVTEKAKPVDANQILSEDTARWLFRQLVHAVQYCHKRHIAHRDLKLANVLLDGSSPPRVKVCDFGLCNTFEDYEMLNQFTIVGTPAYMPPEVLKDIKAKVNYDPFKADVWSLGVILYTMLRGRFPFQSTSKNIRDLLRDISLAHRTDPHHLWEVAWANANLSPEVKDLVDRCLDMEAQARITLPEIMEHVWFVRPIPEPYRQSENFIRTAQREWDKAESTITAPKEAKIKKMVHEATIEHGHPGEIFEWFPPRASRVRTEASHVDITKLGNREAISTPNGLAATPRPSGEGC